MKWGAPRAFFAERCADTEDEREWMSGEVLYAHYRRRCFRADERPLGRERFQADLDRRTKGRSSEINGAVIYPLEILDEEDWGASNTRGRRPSSSAPPRIRPLLRVLKAQAYRDSPLPVGALVRWLEPTWSEKKCLARGDLVVEWQGVRRYIKSDAAEVVD